MASALTFQGVFPLVFICVRWAAGMQQGRAIQLRGLVMNADYLCAPSNGANRGGSQRPRLPWGNPTVLSGAAVGHDRVRDGTGWGHRALGHEPPGWAPGLVAQVQRSGRSGRSTSSSRGGTRQGWGYNRTTRTRRRRTVLGHEHGSAPVGCPPSTCRLATRSSSGGLTRFTDGDTRLAEGFPLRCFQRFARPNVATQRCRLPDNWSTSGSSSPVLSY